MEEPAPLNPSLPEGYLSRLGTRGRLRVFAGAGWPRAGRWASEGTTPALGREEVEAQVAGDWGPKGSRLWR